MTDPIDLLDEAVSRLSAAVHPMWPDRRMFAVSVGDLRHLLALARDAERLRGLEEAAREVHYLMDEDAEPEDESYICGGCGLEWPCRVAAALEGTDR